MRKGQLRPGEMSVCPSWVAKNGRRKRTRKNKERTRKSEVGLTEVRDKAKDLEVRRHVIGPV